MLINRMASEGTVSFLIDSLAKELGDEHHIRPATYFDSADRWIDHTACEFPGMRWWVTVRLNFGGKRARFSLVTCAVPSRLKSSQKVAVATQNTTCPGAAGVPLATTVAVNVTGL